MKSDGRILVVLAALALTSGAALAAEPAPVLVISAAPLPVPVPTFEWAGAYAGAYGGAILGDAYQAGLQGGYNFTTGAFLYGVEAQLGTAFSGGFVLEADLNGRAGLVFGDNFLGYGEAGVGYLGGGNGYIYTLGGGMEIAVGQSISIFGEAKALGAFGAGFTGATVQAGINWHPNY